MNNANDTSVYEFEVKGGFDIKNNLQLHESCIGETVGFRLPDGRLVRPVVGLEVESADGTKFEYITDGSTMSELGFEGLDYGDVRFFAVGDTDDECRVDADGCLIDNDGDAEADMEERLRRDEKNGLYPEKWDIAN